MAKSSVVTLLTDFGTVDPYVAAMKGALLSKAPNVQIVDLSHEIPPQDVLTAAMVLGEAARHFPAGTLHLAVVDPGVGTERRILAGRFGGQLFLFPDNGIITFVAQKLTLETIVTVRNIKYLPATAPSQTFHGRDVFAPVAGHILSGVELSKLGPVPESYKLLDLPVPQEGPDEIAGEVIYVDRFGNLVSNIRESAVRERFSALSAVRVFCAGRKVGPLQGTYGFVEPGEPLALFNSMGYVEVAVNRGSARETLNAKIGDEIRVARKGR